MARFCNKCNYPVGEGETHCSECGSDDIRDTSNLAGENTPLPDVVDTSDLVINEEENTNNLTSIPNSSNVEVGIPEMVSIGGSSNNFIPVPIQRDSPMVDINPKKEKEIVTEPDVNIKPPRNMEESKTEEKKASFGDVPEYMSEDSKKGESPNVLSEPNLSGRIQNENIAHKRNQAKRKKQTGKVAIIVGAGAVFLFLMACMFGFLYYYGSMPDTNDGKAVMEGPFKGEDLTASGNSTPGVDYSTIFTPENSFRVGNENYGYISIPNTWVKFADVDGNTTLQYSDNGTWIVTLYAVPTNTLSAVDWANNVYSNLANNGGKNISTSTTTINSYTALTITAYYEQQNKYLTTWFLESKTGNTHYLAIEGPANTGDNYNIIYSFRENS